MPLPRRIIERGKQGVSPLNMGNTRQQGVGFGYVFIPPGVDRDKFVETCFRNSKISIIDDSCGNIIHDCYISSEAMQNIKFPRIVGEMGMPVVWVSQPFLTNPMVIGTFTKFNDVDIRSDEEFDIIRRWDNNTLSIQGSAREGTLFIKSDGEKFSTILIETEGGENSVIRVRSSGDVEVSADKNVNILSCTNLSVNTVDPETGNMSGFTSNKDVTEYACNYGKDDDKKWVKTTITEDGIVSELNMGSSEYLSIIDKDMCDITYKDCYIQMSENITTVAQDKTKIEIEKNKISITNQVTGLGALMSELLDLVKTLIVLTPVGPSTGLGPNSMASIVKIEALLKQFFNK